MEDKNPRTAAMEFVGQKVRDLLAAEQIAADSNLIEEGLSSLMIMQIAGGLRKYKLRISFAALIEKPTLRDWAELINKAKIKEAGQVPERAAERAVERAAEESGGEPGKETGKELGKEPGEELAEGPADEPGGQFPLTDVQYAYWVGRDDGQPLGGVGCHAYLEFHGQSIDPLRLKLAWNALQRHHPMLRAKFFPNGRQAIMPSPYSEGIEVFELGGLAPDELQEELLSLRSARSHRKLKVEEGEVAGLALALLPDGTGRLFLDVDLLVADVLSLSLIIRDLAEAYLGKRLGEPPEYTFQDYIRSREEEAENQEREEDKRFWEGKLQAMDWEGLRMPLQTKPELIGKTRFSRRQASVGREDWQRIRQTAARCQSTPSMILLTAYALVLERWCSQESFFINIPLFNREMEDGRISAMVADFTNLLLVEFIKKPQETFLMTMERVKSTFLENVSHSGYSGVRVQRDHFGKMGGTGFVAPVVFACNIDYPLETPLSRQALGGVGYMVSQTPQVWLDFQTYAHDGELMLCWDAVDELFPEGLVDDMFDALQDLIQGLAQHDDWNQEFDVLPPRQKAQRAGELASLLPLCPPPKTLLSGFLSHVRQNPDSIALIDGRTQGSITYGELYRRALAVAGLLVRKGVQPGDYMGIFLPRGCGQIYAILGILMAGGAYVPIGINQPEERRRKLYKQIGLKALVTHREAFPGGPPDHEGILVVELEAGINKEGMDREGSDREGMDPGGLEVETDTGGLEVGTDTGGLEKPVMVSLQDSAYVIMTSGSTGSPKGVEISHEGAVNTIEDINGKFGISARDSVLMVSAIDFDLSVYDLFGMLSAGGRVIVLDEENYKDPDVWLKLMQHYSLSVWNSVPVLFDMLVTMAERREAPLDLRLVMLSGDWIGLDLPRRFFELNRNATVVALGGATEASIWSNYQVVPERLPSDWLTIPYGQPLKNQIYKGMDQWARVCPNYVAGELWIGGAGVAKGYKGDEELTGRKFKTDTIRWYKTGDSGRMWEDGTIELLGRLDNQIKIKGYRIETGEVESALMKLPGVANAVVCLSEENGDKVLAAYLVAKEKAKAKEKTEEKRYAEVEGVKEALAACLPHYMIPAVYVWAGELPLTVNGKPDKRQISELLKNRWQKTSFSPPEGALEGQIAKVWQEVLHKKELSRHDNFFKLGGDSLKAVEIVTKAGAVLKLPLMISIQTLFRCPTLREFALEIAKLGTGYEEEII